MACLSVHGILATVEMHIRILITGLSLGPRMMFVPLYIT